MSGAGDVGVGDGAAAGGEQGDVGERTRGDAWVDGAGAGSLGERPTAGGQEAVELFFSRFPSWR